MKKLTAIILIVFAAVGQSIAQSSATSVSYDKSSKPALKLELPYDEGISEDFILANLKKTGYDVETKGKLFWKQNKMNGFYVFKDVRLAGISNAVDLYFKVERLGRKSKDESIIYLLVSTGNETFISSSSDDGIYDAAKNFLNGFVEQSAAYKLDRDIQDQEEVVKNAEKKFSKLQENENEMNKKIRELEEDLKKNKNDQEDQKQAIENEKKKLENLKEKKN